MILIEQIEYALKAKFPIIYMHSVEEQRIMQNLAHLSAQFDEKHVIVSWSCTAEHKEPMAAINHFLKNQKQGFLVLKDLAYFMKNPVLIRTLKDAYFQLAEQNSRAIFIIDAEKIIPKSLNNQLFIIDVNVPEVNELKVLLKEVQAEYPQHQLGNAEINDMLLSLKGLTLNEAKHTLHEIFSHAQIDVDFIMDRIHQSKKMLVNQAGFLQYVAKLVDIEQVGGLYVLKKWITKRAKVFVSERLETDVPIPKGILVMGISGCGKSLCAKVIAKMWKVPLFRLDMNQVFSGLYGSPEATFSKAIAIIESVAPVVLWIDEIENGLGFSQKHESASQAQIISAFLTWMQEKSSNVFVVATANNIEVLPAEMIRKGRFDQVFFCDLPDEKERIEIFSIHIRLHGGDPGIFDMNRLVLFTQNWNAAEIEHLVKIAKVEAYQENRAMNIEDIIKLSRDIIPLSKTMDQQIQFIRDWAWDRAMPASKEKSMALTL